MTRLLGLWLVVAACVGEAPPDPMPAPGGTPGAVATDDDGAPDTQSSISPTGYLERIATLQCEQAFACRDAYPGEAAAFEATWSTSVPVCATKLVMQWNAPMIETDIAKGRISFDGSAAIACLGNVAFGSCTEHWETGIQWAEPCYHVLVGTVTTGEACETKYACVSNACDLVARRCQ